MCVPRVKFFSARYDEMQIIMTNTPKTIPSTAAMSSPAEKKDREFLGIGVQCRSNKAIYFEGLFINLLLDSKIVLTKTILHDNKVGLMP